MADILLNSKTLSLKNKGGTSGAYDLIFYVYQTANQDITNNRTPIRIDLYLKANKNYYTISNQQPIGKISLYDTRTTQTTEVASAVINSIGSKETKKICSYSTNIQHKDDGSLSIRVTGTLTNTLTNEILPQAGEILSELISLPNIARATSCPTINATIGVQTSMVIQPSSSSFTHTVRYNFGSTSGTLITKTSLTTIPLTFSDKNNLYAQIPNANVGQGTLYLDTYNGNTLIGTTTAIFYLYVNEAECKPTCNFTYKDTRTAITGLTGNNQIIVLGQSNIEFTITKQTKYSASVSEVKINGTAIGTSASTYTLNNCPTNVLTLYIKDSRGYEATKTITVSNYVDYKALSCNAIFYRPSPTTGQIKLKVDGSYFSGNIGSTANTLSLKWRYKEHTSSSWSSYTNLTPTITASTKTYKINDISLGTGFNYQKAYDFQIVYADRIITSNNTFSQTVSQGIPIIWWNDTIFGISKILELNGVTIEVVDQ